MSTDPNTPQGQIALEAGYKRDQRPLVNWSDYAKALSMGLDRQPKTLESQSLSGEVTRRIENWEVEIRVRRNARRSRRSHFVASVGRILGDLLAAAETDVQRWSFHSLSKDAFTGLPVSYRDFLSIYKAMLGLGLIEVLPGYYQRTSPFGGSGYKATGKATRFRATRRLSELAEEIGIGRGHAKHHFIRDLPRFPLVLKAASTRSGGIKHSGRTMRFKHDDRTRRLEAEVHEINRLLTGTISPEGRTAAIAASSTAATNPISSGTRAAGSTAKARTATSASTKTSGSRCSLTVSPWSRST